VREKPLAAPFLTNTVDKLIIGEITKLDKHPNADGLQIVEVNIKDRSVSLITGATNIKIGDIVPVALPGARVNSPEGKVVKIEKGKLRGIVSFGMLASELELGVGKDHTGICILDINLKDKIGSPVKNYVNININIQ
jgi:phenylalanyl-tRNA synthetase beta chain